jgi:hypothetical protein
MALQKKKGTLMGFLFRTDEGKTHIVNSPYLEREQPMLKHSAIPNELDRIISCLTFYCICRMFICIMIQ